MAESVDGMNNVEWSRQEWPFPYITAKNVFTNEFYRCLALQFHLILQFGLSEKPAHGRFFRMVSYDAYGMAFDSSLAGCLTVFTSPTWHDLITGLFGVKGTGHLYIGAHHHTPGSSTGGIHNDFNPAWFPVDGVGRIRFPDHGRCAYTTGAGLLSDSEKALVVRAVAMIFYLDNDGWISGDGGETGLFETKKPLKGPSARIAPENNSILLFECTPCSYHAFLSNPGRARNSIIAWAHRTKEDALTRWRESDLEKWRA